MLTIFFLIKVDELLLLVFWMNKFFFERFYKVMNSLRRHPILLEGTFEQTIDILLCVNLLSCNLRFSLKPKF